MKLLKLALLAAVGSMALTGAAQAADRPLGLTFNAGAATNYEFRGVTQTQHDPQVFAGADVTIAEIGYAGAWVSNVDFGTNTDIEYDLYAGVKPKLGAVTFDFGAIRYGYTHGDSNDYDYWEFKAAGSVPVGPATVGAAFYYSPNTWGAGNVNAYYYELNASAAIPETKFSVSGAVGRQEYQGIGDYTTWNLGAGYALNDTVGFDLRYWDTASAEKSFYGSTADAKLVAGLKVTF
ncbi:TorF family putative porin [Phenylobacterium sp. LjRoot225]|uniref:TorF family putative porin n=1 Tax=Phenylobacterium sp. LjRoot225 TaxID=3342285 RepID=UPI003ECEA334